jgi:hypothetical protein
MTVVLDKIRLIVILPTIIIFLCSKALFLKCLLEVQIFYIAVVELEPLLLV